MSAASQPVAGPPPEPQAHEYRPDLDCIRILALLFVHFHHVALVFGPLWWLIKSPVTIEALRPAILYPQFIRLPLLMVVSGAATAYALRGRTVKGLMGDRAKRLLIPLVFGIFFISPPQLYIEKLSKGTFQGSYLDFYPSVFEFVPWPAGSLSWTHLWLLIYLFLYNVLLIPLFGWMRSSRAESFRAGLEAFLLRGHNVWLLFLPVALVHVWLHRFPMTMALVNDPRLFLHLFTFFLIGYLFGNSPRIWDHLAARRKAYSVAALVVVAIMSAPWLLGPDVDYPRVPKTLGRYLAAWGVIMACIGWARALVTRTTPLLKFMRDRAYPIYILHEVVLVVMAYPMVHLPLNPWVLFFLTLFGTLAVTMLATEVFYRVPLLRPLVGLRFRRSSKPAAEPAPVVPALPGA